MSNNHFVKGECRQCAGHLEFPAAAAGETIACPHCGQPTELVASVSTNKIKASRRKWLTAALAVLVVANGLAAIYFLMKKPDHAAITETKTVPAAPTNASTISIKPLVVQPKPPDENHTNDFTISPIKLEKTPGSSLVYVTGKIQNLTSRQRFGVKVEFRLFDTNGAAIGKATDYQPVLEPDGDWRFKAMIMESEAVSAQLNSIREDQQ